ncbi:MAG: TIM barrel protein [Promethearchaeota archaeon]
MKFTNDVVRIGPTGAQKGSFFMTGRGGKLRKGKRSELPEYFSNLGLNAYEFSAGRMAKFSDSPEYAKFRVNAKKLDMAISIHAPYYISLTSVNPEIYQSSIRRIANVYAWAVWLNAKRIVLHPGSYGKKSDSSTQLIEQITEGISEGMAMAEDLFPDLKSQFQEICLCPETMGKHGQLGTVEEVITICKDLGLNRVRPCIDFGHVYARNLGKLTGRRLYESVFEQLEQELGTHIIQHLHIHYSRIEFTKRGEKMHHPNTSTLWGPEIDPLFDIIKGQDLTPIIINESPELEPDAVLLMNQWKHLQKAT